MTYLSEDPSYLAGGLLMLAGAFLLQSTLRSEANTWFMLERPLGWRCGRSDRMAMDYRQRANREGGL